MHSDRVTPPLTSELNPEQMRKLFDYVTEALEVGACVEHDKISIQLRKEVVARVNRDDIIAGMAGMTLRVWSVDVHRVIRLTGTDSSAALLQQDVYRGDEKLKKLKKGLLSSSNKAKPADKSSPAAATIEPGALLR